MRTVQRAKRCHIFQEAGSSSSNYRQTVGRGQYAAIQTTDYKTVSSENSVECLVKTAKRMAHGAKRKNDYRLLMTDKKRNLLSAVSDQLSPSAKR